MSREILLEDAEKILSDVRPEQCFWIHNGPIVRNLHELEKGIEHMDNETFIYHVNNGRNDFANWVRDILKDNELADDMQKSMSKSKLSKKMRNRITFLENYINEENIKGLNLKAEHEHLQHNVSLNGKFDKNFGIFMLGLIVGMIAGILIAIKFEIG